MYVPLSTTSIVSYSVSYVHIPLLLIITTQFNCNVDIQVCTLRTWCTFSFYVVYKSNMLLCCFQNIIEFMIDWFFLVPTFRNLMVCVLAQLIVCQSLSCIQPNNPQNQKKKTKKKRFENIINACYRSVKVKFIRIQKYVKSSHNKSTYVLFKL